MAVHRVRAFTGFMAGVAFLALSLQSSQAETRPTPVVIVGGSAAAGWHDATGKGYIVRALDTLPKRLAVENKAIPGSRVINPQVRARFPRWMSNTRGGLLIIAWGYLNDLRLQTPQRSIVQAIHWEIAEGLKTGHAVLLVSPPATAPTFTFDAKAELVLWHRISTMARHDFRRSPVSVFNVMSRMKDDIMAHGQTYQPYMKGAWDPNTRGHRLAARILTEELMP